MSNLTIDQRVALANELLTGTSIKPIVMPKPKARTRKPATAKPQTANTAKNWKGQTMLSDAGTITKGQIRNITGICERNGEPMTASEISDIRQYSMVAASNFYRGLQEDYGVAR